MGPTLGRALAVVFCLAAPAAAADRAQAVREAFKALKLPAASKLEKDVSAALPAGIVIEAKPFHDLIARFGGPLEAVFDARDAAVGALKDAPTVAEADALAAGWKVVDGEVEDQLARVAAVEARYAEVYNLEWDASGEKERTTRKLAAVLVPLYRRLLQREADVAAHAADALAGLRDAAGVAWLAKTGVADPSPGLRAAVADALGRVRGPEGLAALRKVASADPEPAVRLRALRALAGGTVAEVKDGAIAALADTAWEVRALAAAICAKGGILDAVGPLIAALGKETGRLRQDFDDALFTLVGVRMDGDAAPWARWWAENQASVATRAQAREAEGAYGKPLGPLDEAPAEAGEAGKEGKGTTSAFYGIETKSKRILFVIDISRSMQDPAQEKPPVVTGGGKDPWAAPKGTGKIAIAKWQLHRAVAALPTDAWFDVIVYSESYRVWQPQMVEASAKGKAKAHEWVDAIVANGTTNVCDALDRAFELAGALPLPVKGEGPAPAARRRHGLPPLRRRPEPRPRHRPRRARGRPGSVVRTRRGSSSTPSASARWRGRRSSPRSPSAPAGTTSASGSAPPAGKQPGPARAGERGRPTVRVRTRPVRPGPRRPPTPPSGRGPTRRASATPSSTGPRPSRRGSTPPGASR